MKAFPLRFMAGLLTIALGMTSLPAPVGAEPPPPSTAANVQTSTDQGLKKIVSPVLREKAATGGDEKNLVIVFMRADSDLQGLLQLPMTRRPMQGITYATGWTKSGNLSKLAGTAGVFAIVSPQDFRVFDPKDPEMQLAEPETPRAIMSIKASLGSVRLTKALAHAQPQEALPVTAALDPPDWYGVSRMGAKAAWAQGFTGQGVIVSDVDSGADFGHPDLDELWQNNVRVKDGVWARVTNASSPYYGWPMAYDPLGAYFYLASGEAFSPKTLCNGTSGSFSTYSDTSAVVHRAPGGTAVLEQVTVDTVPYGNCTGIVNKTYTLPNTSKSGNYHVGIHPDSLLGLYQPEDLSYAAVLVVDEQTAGVYDTVYVDWDGNLQFDPWEKFTKDHPTGWYYDPTKTPPMSRDVTGDGIADVSAGLLHWIADGANYIPGTDVVYVPPIVKPASGSLVLWYGDFNGQSHGTATTSSVAARGVITSKRGSKTSTSITYGPWLLPDWDTASHGVVWGTAPEAKIFAGYSTFPTDVWYLSALGYDGLPGTGDEAQVSTNSFGYFYLNDGWDPIARFVTYLNAVEGLDRTTWLSGTANGGFGYGTAASPGSAATGLAIGAVDHKGVLKSETSRATDSQEWVTGPSQILYGDITPFSSRGPTTMAQSRPNVMAIGDGAPGDVPLNLSAWALRTYGEPEAQAVDGNRAWELFGGTSEATPFAAGITALIYQAAKANPAFGGQWPTYAQAKAILMSSANDAGNDAFVQGAGVVDAERAVKIAKGDLGVYVDPPQWVLGSYRGQSYLSFANIINPCESSSRVFQVHNPTQTTANVQIEAKTWEEIGQLEYTVTTTLAQESTARILRPDYLLTLYDKAKGINELAKVPQYDLADMIKVSISNPYGQSSLSDPTKSPQSLDSSWYMKVYEWQDLNKNGILWNDANGNGVVNDGEMDNSPGTTNPYVSNSSQEFNAYALSYQVAPTTHEIRIGTVDGQKPWARLQERNADGLFIGLRHSYRSGSIASTTISVRVTLYQERDWPAVGFTGLGAGNSLVVPPGASSGFTATAQAGCDWDPGLYEGAILVKFDPASPNYHGISIPLLFNVAMQPAASAFRYEFGNAWAGWPVADPPANVPYDNQRIYGGQDWLSNGWYDQGDWRLFYADVTDAQFEALPRKAKWIVDTRWLAKPTDIDTLVYGPTSDYYSTNWPEVFGPYDLALKGGSDDTVYRPPLGGYAYTFRTNTGGPREIISADLTPGLNGIFLHNVLYGGLDTSEPFAGRAGYAAVYPNPVSIDAKSSSGSLDMTFQSSLDWANGLGATAYGLGSPTTWKDVPIHQGESWYQEFDANQAASIELSTSSTDPGTKDIDLYLQKWDGSWWQSIASSAGATATEYIKVRLPADGRYRAQVYGFTVTGDGKFDFSKKVIQGDDLTVTDLPTGPIAAGEAVTFKLNYDHFPVQGDSYGVLLLGPAEAPGAIEIPVKLSGYSVYLPLVVRS